MQRVKVNSSLYFAVNNITLKMYAIAQWNTKEVIVFKKVGIEALFKYGSPTLSTGDKHDRTVTCSDKTFDSKLSGKLSAQYVSVNWFLLLRLAVFAMRVFVFWHKEIASVSTGMTGMTSKR